MVSSWAEKCAGSFLWAFERGVGFILVPTLCHFLVVTDDLENAYRRTKWNTKQYVGLKTDRLEYAGRRPPQGQISKSVFKVDG